MQDQQLRDTGFIKADDLKTYSSYLSHIEGVKHRLTRDARRVFKVFTQALPISFWEWDEILGKVNAAKLRGKILEGWLQGWGMPSVYAQTRGQSASMDVVLPEMEKEFLAHFNINADSPGAPRAIYDYRGSVSENIEDYQIPLMLAAIDRNLKLTLWFNAADEDMTHLKRGLQQYAVKHYGAYPKNLLIEKAPQSIFGELASRVRRGKVPAGFVSSDEKILPRFNAIRGLIVAAGSSSAGIQDLTEILLFKRTLKLGRDELETMIYTGQDLAEGRLAELLETHGRARSEIRRAA